MERKTGSMVEVALERVAPETLTEVLEIYEAVHTALENGVNGPGWRRGVYPAEADARAALEANTLYLTRDADTGRAAATIVLNRDQPPAYVGAPWRLQAPADRILVVHTFMVHPGFRRQGFGGRTLSAAHALARAEGNLSIRLDTYAENYPAQALYERLGYRRIDRIDLGYGQYGLHWFLAYELEL